MSASDAHDVGAFYTNRPVARYMARCLLAPDVQSVLEPSFGDGVFLDAVHEAVSQRCSGIGVDLYGVELVEETHARTVARGLIDPRNAIQGDFLEIRPFEVDAVIGNPPYIRLRNLDTESAALALGVAQGVLGEPMETSGSVWMPFVLHATRFLRPGGRLALVLPFDLTYVRYARPLWAYLGSRFSTLRLVRVRQRLFDDVLQRVVLLFASGFGGTTDTIGFEAFETLSDLETGNALVQSDVAVAAVVEGQRAFLRSCLRPELRELLDRIEPRTSRVRDVASFHIGYVTGDKGFFHPPAGVREELPETSRRRAITSSRQLSSIGLRTSSLDPASADELFLPSSDCSAHTKAEKTYIDSGEENEVDQRYKCRVRDPWFVVPGVHRPDLLLSVFASCPVLAINDADYVATNSLLCGFLNEGVDAEVFAASWYTSLTLLYCELEVHALGGGVMVIVPREAGNIRMASPEMVPEDYRHFDTIDFRLKDGDTTGAYLRGDREILRTGLGLTMKEVQLIREGIETLWAWRTAKGTLFDQD